jgi:glutamate dehydrogenase (NAD(P)+)
VSYFEWVQNTQELAWTLEETNDRLHKMLKGAFQRALLRSQRDGTDMRTAALIEGIDRVVQAKRLRGIFP